MIGRLLILWLTLSLGIVADRGRLTLAQVRKLPATVDVRTAALALGIGKSTLYEAIRLGESPVKSLTVRGRVVVLTSDLIRVLKGDENDDAAA